MQKASLVLMALLALSAVTLFNLGPKEDSNWPEKSEFDQWKMEFGKVYSSEVEEKYRYQLFYKNLLMIAQHNLRHEAGEELSTLRLNQFSDLTVQEFKKAYLSSHVTTEDFTCKGPQYTKKTSFNDTFMTTPSMLTAVSEQGGQCVAGYAFATASAVQASMYKTIKQIFPVTVDQIVNCIFPLSVQQLIDCSTQTGNNGCINGNSLNALNYLIDKGSMKSSDYAFTGRTDDCKYTQAQEVWDVKSCTKVDADLSMLKSQILQQPVIVGFDASDITFLQLGTGLYTPRNCKTNINHYMLAVGWGQQTVGSVIKSTNYYIVVKNSFGPKWGESGYGKVVVKVNSTENSMCGMLTSMYFPYGSVANSL